MIPKTSFVTVLAVALVAVPAAWGQASLDAFERAVAAQPAVDSTPIVSPNASDRALAAKAALDSTPMVSPDAVDRMKATQSQPITSPDAFDRAFREVDTRPVATSTISSGRDIEWTQIGMGFGLGIVLALGLLLVMHYTRIRQPAH